MPRTTAVATLSASQPRQVSGGQICWLQGLIEDFRHLRSSKMKSFDTHDSIHCILPAQPSTTAHFQSPLHGVEQSTLILVRFKDLFLIAHVLAQGCPSVLRTGAPPTGGLGECYKLSSGLVVQDRSAGRPSFSEHCTL